MRGAHRRPAWLIVPGVACLGRPGRGAWRIVVALALNVAVALVAGVAVPTTADAQLAKPVAQWPRAPVARSAKVQLGTQAARSAQLQTGTPAARSAQLQTGTPAARSAESRTPVARPTQPVDWPTVAAPEDLPLVVETARYRIRVGEDDAFLVSTAERWAPTVESLLLLVQTRIGLDPPEELIDVTFARTYAAACPARGLAVRLETGPRVIVFVDETTTDLQIRGVLAHELVHVLTMRETFVGDGVLTEGIANWGAGTFMLAWQGYPSWEAAVRAYIQSGSYVSVADSDGLGPAPGEDCLERRDRVYNARAGFTGWLAERSGLGTVLAMPPRTVVIESGNGGREEHTEPDYEAATGFTLPQLETIWLAEITGQL